MNHLLFATTSHARKTTVSFVLHDSAGPHEMHQTHESLLMIAAYQAFTTAIEQAQDI